jgi:type IV pilus assembly protein PilY1
MNRKFLKNAGGALLVFFASASAHAGVTDLASAPLVTSSSSAVGPNLMMLLDDSGSMDWNYLPDWANTSDQTLFKNNTYNGVAYSAAVTYSQPVYFNADGTVNTTTYPSMTAANTSTWSVVPDDGYKKQSTSTSNLVGNASFYTFVAGEYCDNPNLRNCVVQSAPSISYPYPATLRWCSTSAMTACQAVRIETGATTYMVARRPTNPPTLSSSSFSISGSGTTSLAGITVNSLQIMNAAANATIAGTTSTSNLATNIRAAVNACTLAVSGGCTVAGYSAGGSSSTVILYGPAGTSITYTPARGAVTGTMTIGTPPAFTGGMPGFDLLTNIVSGTISYPFPGTTAKASTRTDCTTGTTCTFAQEMTNYANWWAYYHTRMQMIKSSASLAFQNVGSNYRVGYAAMNNNQGSAFVNPAAFNATNKLVWYNKFFGAIPNNTTPLRDFLASIGRFYAGKYDGSSFNGVTVTDPMQYSCQQNFSIVATDGYWNEATNPNQIDGSTDIGNQDSAEARPYNDGGGVIVTKVTPTVTTTKVTTTGRSTLDRSTRTDVTTSTTTQTGTNTYAQTTVARVSSGTCSSRNQQSSYTGTLTQTVTKVTTSSQPKEVLTTTGYTDVATSTSTSTETVVTTSGTVTSDTTAVTTTGPSTVSGVTSGPSVVVNSLGSPTVTGPTTTTTSSSISWGTPTISCVPSTTSATGPTLLTTGALSPASPTPTATTTTGSLTHTAGYPHAASAGTASTVVTGPTVGATTTTSTTSGGTSNTLADTAEYYYVTDLRTPALGNCTGSLGLDVCDNDVPTSGLDSASWQHMTLFTMALGASGYMQYQPGYPTATSGDYFDVANGTVANPSAGICSWQTSGACNWPVPVSNIQTTIDDLWHAAVNGRGSYFSATNPATLNAGLTSALSGVSARTGSSAAATTSNPNVTSGDNFVFSSTFTTQEWDGELVRQQLDLGTGAVSNTIDWSAQGQLDNVTLLNPTNYTTRKIYAFSSTAANKLMLFNWTNLSAAQQAYFTTPAISPLSQFCVSGVTCLSAANQTSAAGQNLVDFLRGERVNEGIPTDLTKYYRQRLHVLGDIVNAEAVYVKLPLFTYQDAGYAAFVTAKASLPRAGAVYVAANDGMLHAFDSTTGAENWTYIPSLVLPNLYKLADKNYQNLHQYFVDGTPVAGDAFFGGAWHTIVVAGLNDGGRGYYALDVTDPANPTALWEFTDANMGYTYGNPVITKTQDGTWVALVTSGYNNVPDANKATGDGVGRLYVLNAATGALIRTISTGVGSVTSPSGLAHTSAWVDNNSIDNTALRAYGGDMQGNLWRFDINGNIGATGYDAQLLTTFYANTAGTVTQPITTRPELGLVATFPVVFVGTGRYLGVSDLTDTTQQSFYAVKDALNTTPWPNPRGSTTTFVQQNLTTGTCPAGSPPTICTIGQVVRVSTSKTVNFATNAGWFIDLSDSGERANTDPALAFGTLGFTTNVPNTSACTAGGYSYRYVLDYRTGAPVSTSTTGVTGIRLGNALATRGVFVRLPNNTVVQLTRLSDGTTMTTNVPIGAGSGGIRRISWRELIQDQ